MAESNNTSFLPEYDAESVIKARKAASERKKLSIESDTVKINGIAYKFLRREFAYGFSMVVPETFEDMPREIAKRMFPYEDRLVGFRGYIKRICPTGVFFSDGIYRLPGGAHIAHYDYRYPAADSDLYDLTFFTDFSDMTLLGWFICPVESKDKWEPLAGEMIQTIQVEGKES
jgi:hypothetical protein